MNWAYIIGGASLTLGLIALLIKLVLDRKDATIQTLNTNVNWLQQQLKEAQNNSPDARAERLLKNTTILEKEIELLSEDQAKNEQIIAEKVNELTTTNEELKKLKTQIERAEEILGNFEYLQEQFCCPHCGGELTTLAGEDVEYRSYSCGDSSGPNGEYACPYDPEFPKLEEYDFAIEQLSSGTFVSQPKPKTKNARTLTLHFHSGATEDEVIRKIKSNYERFAPKILKEPQVET